MSIGLAARLGDPVGAHSGIGSGGRILMSALKYAAIGAVAAALVVAAVAAAPAIIAGVTAGAAIGAVGAAAGGAVIASVSTFGGALMAGSAVLGVGLSGAAQGIAKQREEESHSHTMGGGCSSINVGSENVIIEGKPAARAKQDTNVHTSPITLKQGSATVFVNGKPLARVGDASDCGGKVIAGASRTYIGGPPSEGGGGALALLVAGAAVWTTPTGTRGNKAWALLDSRSAFSRLVACSVASSVLREGCGLHSRRRRA